MGERAMTGPDAVERGQETAQDAAVERGQELLAKMAEAREKSLAWHEQEARERALAPPRYHYRIEFDADMDTATRILALVMQLDTSNRTYTGPRLGLVPNTSGGEVSIDAQAVDKARR